MTPIWLMIVIGLMALPVGLSFLVGVSELLGVTANSFSHQDYPFGAKNVGPVYNSSSTYAAYMLVQTALSGGVLALLLVRRKGYFVFGFGVWLVVMMISASLLTWAE